MVSYSPTMSQLKKNNVCTLYEHVYIDVKAMTNNKKRKYEIYNKRVLRPNISNTEI